MVQRTVDGFFLGTIYDLDPDESDFDTEFRGDLIGQTAGSGTPLHERIEPIKLDDADNNGAVRSNDTGQPSEDIIYQGVAHALDSLVEYNVTITYVDGTTATTVMNLIQKTSGRVFLLPRREGNPQNDVLDDGAIDTLRFDSVAGDNYGGITASIEQNAFVTYFAAGTRIACPEGERAVETLSVGDLVLTVGHGSQTVRWIGCSIRLGTGKAAPVRITAGALGPNVPVRPLLVSQQHRLMLRSQIAQRMYGEAEILVAACKLLDKPVISLAPRAATVSYFHILFDRHEIVLAEGAPAESFLPGAVGVTALSEPDRVALKELGVDALCESARPFADKASRIRRMVARHAKNKKALVS